MAGSDVELHCLYMHLIKLIPFQTSKNISKQTNKNNPETFYNSGALLFHASMSDIPLLDSLLIGYTVAMQSPDALLHLSKGENTTHNEQYRVTFKMVYRGKKIKRHLFFWNSKALQRHLRIQILNFFPITQHFSLARNIFSDSV